MRDCSLVQLTLRACYSVKYGDIRAPKLKGLQGTRSARNVVWF